MTFGARVRHYRERRRWSCNELARIVGVDASYISRLELGEREPPRRPIDERMANALQLKRGARAELFVAAGLWPDTWPPAVVAAVTALWEARDGPGAADTDVSTV